jgi:hypothetical protein
MNNEAPGLGFSAGNLTWNTWIRYSKRWINAWSCFSPVWC